METEGNFYNNQVNQTGQASGNMLHYKLDTDNIRVNFESFLKGSRQQIIKDETTGEVKILNVYTGTPRANALGIADLLGMFDMLVNNHTVQGNIPSWEDFKDEMKIIDADMRLTIGLNSMKYEIDDNMIEFIISHFSSLISLFISRTVGDGERKSQNTFSHSETMVKEGKKGFSLFNNN